MKGEAYQGIVVDELRVGERWGARTLLWVGLSFVWGGEIFCTDFSPVFRYLAPVLELRKENSYQVEY